MGEFVLSSREPAEQEAMGAEAAEKKREAESTATFGRGRGREVSLSVAFRRVGVTMRNNRRSGVLSAVLLLSWLCSALLQQVALGAEVAEPPLQFDWQFEAEG